MAVASGSQALASDMLKHLDASGYLDFASSTVLTLASGAVTQVQNFHRIAGEGGAADDLDTITKASDVTDGYVLVLRPSSDSVTITVKHGTGNIQCVGNGDIVLDDDHDICLLIYDSNLTAWMALGVNAQQAAADYGYWIPAMLSQPVGATTLLADQTHAILVYLPFQLRVTKLVSEVTTAQAGKQFSSGLYTPDGNTRLITSGAVSAASTGVKTTTLGTPVILTPGFYWYAFANDGDTAQFRVNPFTGTLFLNDILEAANMGLAANTPTAGVIPATLGVISAASWQQALTTRFQG